MLKDRSIQFNLVIIARNLARGVLNRMHISWLLSFLVGTRQKKRVIMLCFTALTACHQPPYNDFKPDEPLLKRTAYGAAVGAVVGSTVGATVVGTVVGGSVVTALGVYKTSKQAVLDRLIKEDIQFVVYGDTYTLIVPTDHFYEFNRAKLNEHCYAGLNDIIRLLDFYPKCRVTVAAFTDDVGTNQHKLKLSRARAETMLGFLWAHNIPAEKLSAEGYGDYFSIGDNQLIRGSAYNRRIEIQWSMLPDQSSRLGFMRGIMK